MKVPAPSPARLRSPLLMGAGAAFLVLNDAIVKGIGEALPLGQVIAIRSAVAVALCLGVVALYRSVPASPFQRDILLRTAFTVGNTFAFVAAVRSLPLSIAVLVDFVSILFVALAAPFLLSEQLTNRRIVAVLIGLLGASLVLLPQFSIVGYAVLLPVLSGALGAARDLWTRKLGSSGPSAVVLTLYASLCMVAVALATGTDDWVGGLSTLHLMAVVAGLCQCAALLLMAQAFRIGEAGLVAPFRLTSLLWALAIGVLYFGDTLYLIQILGVLGICCGLAMTVVPRGRSSNGWFGP